MPIGAFKLDTNVEIAFRPNIDPEVTAKQHLQTRLAGTMPTDVWLGNNYSKLVFSVKWCTNGLVPVRPQIVLTKNVTLAPGKSLLLN